MLIKVKKQIIVKSEQMMVFFDVGVFCKLLQFVFGGEWPQLLSLLILVPKPVLWD